MTDKDHVAEAIASLKGAIEPLDRAIGALASEIALTSQDALAPGARHALADLIDAQAEIIMALSKIEALMAVRHIGRHDERPAWPPEDAPRTGDAAKAERSRERKQ